MNSTLNENFDCTQLISFKWEEKEKPSLNDVNLFESIGFDVLMDDSIRQVKKEYFKTYDCEYFIELFNQEFSGEFEDWLVYDAPPLLILQFVDAMNLFISANDFKDFKIFISFFSESGVSTNHSLLVNSSELLTALFLMSKNNFDVWADNLIINILD
ncbi:hypothetical protein [Edaphovirga cremea]|uniref:hypothetical protein n=1 Tax=Edaphovirga cremea TaxID=2267246 RepID=UPI0039892630